jgi:hypothetical protein
VGVVAQPTWQCEVKHWTNAVQNALAEITEQVLEIFGVLGSSPNSRVRSAKRPRPSWQCHAEWINVRCEQLRLVDQPVMDRV